MGVVLVRGPLTLLFILAILPYKSTVSGSKYLGAEQAQTHGVQPQEHCHGFSAIWESSICERKLIYPAGPRPSPIQGKRALTFAQY